MGSDATQPFVRARIRTGTYTGNGADDRNINIGIDLASKSNRYLIIKQLGSQVAMHRIDYAQGDLTMDFGGSGDIANVLQAFTATGFQVGSHNVANQSPSFYRYIVFWEEP